MQYLIKKGFKVAKPEKRKREKFLSSEDVTRILNAVAEDKDNPNLWRDHCAIFLGYHFGLRAGETAILERNTFRDIEDGIAHIRTLKQSEKIQFSCKECGKKVMLARARAGKPWRCRKCDSLGQVQTPRFERNAEAPPPEKQPPLIEEHVQEYVMDYLRNAIPPEQRWLFEGYKDQHLSTTQLRNIFNSYAARAGLSTMFSWHALRHGRGVLLWEKFKDAVVVRDMLRQKSIGSTEVYMHLSPQRAEEMKLKLGESAIAANPPFKQRNK